MRRVSGSLAPSFSNVERSWLNFKYKVWVQVKWAKKTKQTGTRAARGHAIFTCLASDLAESAFLVSIKVQTQMSPFIMSLLTAPLPLSLLRCEGFLKRVSCFYRCSPDAARWPHPHRRSYIQAVPLCHSFCRDWWGCQVHCQAKLNQNQFPSERLTRERGRTASQCINSPRRCPR